MAKTNSTPPYLLALGRKSPPETIHVCDTAYRLDHVFKHDFFAFTARYAADHQPGDRQARSGDSDRVILKIGRRAPLFGLPLGWIGRWLASRESAAFIRASGIAAVPELLGRYGPAGFVHTYVEGAPMQKGQRVPDDFFARLRDALGEIHQRGMAYVDLEKCENVIVGDDGQPYLIDFQISWQWPRRWGGDLPPLSWIRGRFQRADLYHALKLQRRTRPDQLSTSEVAASYRRPFYIRMYGIVTRPFTLLRRRILNRVDPKQKRGERGRVDLPASK